MKLLMTKYTWFKRAENMFKGRIKILVHILQSKNYLNNIENKLFSNVSHYKKVTIQEIYKNTPP